MACKGGSCSRASNLGGNSGGLPGPLKYLQGPALSPVYNAARSGKNPWLTENVVPKSKFWSGTPAYNTTQPTLTPEQYGLQNQTLSGAGNLLQQIMGNRGQFDFAPIAQEARENFYSSTVPSLAERFTSMGAGAQGSSDFRGAIGAAGQSLNRGLASLKQQYGLQQQGLDQNLLSQLLGSGLGTQSFENQYFQRQPGFAENFTTNVAGPAVKTAVKLGGKYLLGV